MNEEDLLVTTGEKLRKIFKKHNLKVTPQRVVIYKELIRSKEHPSATVIFDRIKRAFPNISFDTVNRTLLTFAELGLIKAVEGSGEPKRFDPNTAIHHHFICVRCGKIVDFKCDEFDKLQIPNEIKDRFNVLGHKVIVEGICDECSKNIKNKK